MGWTRQNAQDIESQGYTRLMPLSAERVGRALDIINRDFERDPPLDDAAWEKCSAETFCPSVVQDLNFLAIETGLYDVAQCAMGALSPIDTAQVARRRRGDQGGAHLDGFFKPGKGEEPSDANTPDAVLGMYLTDVLVIQDGPFVTFPDARRGVQAWAKALTSTPKTNEANWPAPDTSAKAPVFGKKGTTFLVHGAILHCNAMRDVEGYRDAVFFRLYKRKRNVLDLLRSGGTAL
jgi:hypothetical protein